MTLAVGIIGLPNVGKSTVFNALSGAQIAEVANYPFCTINPNHAIVPVPDHRVENLETWSAYRTPSTPQLSLSTSLDWSKAPAEGRVLATSSSPTFATLLRLCTLCAV